MNEPLNNHKGFTLIELLVVISIISLLSSVVLSSLNGARAKARDAKRLEDIHQIVNAFYLALDANGGSFPSSGGVGVCLGTSGTCWGNVFSGSVSINTLLQPYLSQIPTDPSRASGRGDRYVYADQNSITAWHCDGSLPLMAVFHTQKVLISYGYQITYLHILTPMIVKTWVFMLVVVLIAVMVDIFVHIKFNNKNY